MALADFAGGFQQAVNQQRDARMREAQLRSEILARLTDADLRRRELDQRDQRAAPRPTPAPSDPCPTSVRRTIGRALHAV
jgi:hypothetical protein